MAWQRTEWACGHVGQMQLYGKSSGRDRRVAYEAGKNCFACWLTDTWKSKNDPRANNPKKWEFAKAIAEGKGIRIKGEEVIESAETSK